MPRKKNKRKEIQAAKRAQANSQRPTRQKVVRIAHVPVGGAGAAVLAAAVLRCTGNKTGSDR